MQSVFPTDIPMRGSPYSSSNPLSLSRRVLGPLGLGVNSPKAPGTSSAKNPSGQMTIDEQAIAFGVEGILPCSYDVQGLVDSRVFELWVTEMLIPTIQVRYPFGGVCVVMDNARFHRERVLQEIFAHAGIDLKFLPAYSPEYKCRLLYF